MSSGNGSGSEQSIWRLATALSGAVTAVDVAIALAEEGAATAGASFANMAVVDQTTKRMWIIHGGDLDLDVADRWAEVEVGVATPLGDAIASGRSVLLCSVDEIAKRYPGLLDDTITAGIGATASFPLLTAEGEAAGAAGFGWEQARTFDDDYMRLLDLICRMAASALERAILAAREVDATAEKERSDARLLQEIFLPRVLPDVQRLDMAALYMPASDAPMGGDWYDVFPVDGGTCFIIGDVAGHGLQAAAVMAQLRNAARAYATEDPAPSAVLTRLNKLLCRLEPDETASAIVVVWDPAEQVIVRATAGHPPPLRCRPDEFGYLDGAGATLLGVDPSTVYTDEVKALRSGTTLVFYTDGLVEQRGESVGDGMRELLDFVQQLDDLSPTALSDAILEWRLDYGRREDDICVLAVRLA